MTLSSFVVSFVAGWIIGALLAYGVVLPWLRRRANARLRRWGR